MKRVFTNVLRSVHYNYRNGGVRQILERVGSRFTQLFIDRTDYLIYHIEAPLLSHGAGVPIRREDLGFEELVALRYFKALYYPEAIRGRFEAGERCHGFFVEDQLANVAWSTRGVLNVDPHLSIECEDGMGIYDCWTMAEFRGRGIYPESLRILLALFAEEQVRTVLIAVDPDNVRSIKGIERAGFLPFKRMKTTVRLGKRFVRSSPFEARFAEPAASAPAGGGPEA